MNTLSKLLLFISIVSFVSKVIITDTLNYYIHPRYNLFVFIMLGVSIFTTLFLLWRFITQLFEKNKSKEENNLKNVFISTIVALFTIYFTFIYDPTYLSSITSESRFVIENSTQHNFRSIESIDIENIGNLEDDWQFIQQVNNHPDISSFDERPIKIEGFAHNYLTKEDNFLVISRLLMRCCVSDATPIIALINVDNISEEEKLILNGPNVWIEIEGTFQSGVFDESLKNDFAFYIKVSDYKFLEEKPQDIDPYLY